MSLLIDIGTADYLTGDVLKCDKCEDLSVGLTFILRTEVTRYMPYSLNIMLPVEAWHELVRQVSAGLEVPKESLNSEEIPCNPINWYAVDNGEGHD